MAHSITRGLIDKKYSVDLHRIQGNTSIDISSYDAIGIGFPVYIYRIPFMVKDFIKTLPELNGKFISPLRHKARRRAEAAWKKRWM